MEKLTYAGNEARCAAWGGSRSACDPDRIGPFHGSAGHCFHRQSCRDVSSSKEWIKDHTRYHWTTASCSIQVKVQSDGKLAIVHDPEKTTLAGWGKVAGVYPDVQSHVNAEKTVSYFHVHWNPSDVEVGKVRFLYGNNFVLSQTRPTPHDILQILH